MSTVPTVRIKSDHPEHDGHMVINADEFDAAKHVLLDPPPPPPAPAAPPPPGAANPLQDLIGTNWKDKDGSELKKLAEVVSGRAVENKKQAVEVIEAALAALPQ